MWERKDGWDSGTWIVDAARQGNDVAGERAMGGREEKLTGRI